MNFFRKFLYIVLNLAILGGIVFSGFKIKEMFSDSSLIIKGKDMSLESSGLGKEIFETKEEIENELPMPEGAVEKTYKWEYKGKKYSISQEFFYSIYDFYKSQPKTYTYFNELPSDWEEEYYGMFIVENKKIDFIGELLDEIVSQGRKNKLSDDQMVELVLAFVQSISYDDQKATNILSRVDGETMNYPYETLFENKGVCSDKSFLALSLIRKLGYGTAIFIYDNENHMAIGIQCPKEYSNYGSGYCYGESTSTGNKIGIIPELKTYAGKAVGGEEISYFTENENQLNKTTKLSEVKIFQKTKGREYKGIVQTIKTNEEIASLKVEIASLGANLKKLKSEVDEFEDNLSSQRKKLDKYLDDGDIDKYNQKAKGYNEDLNEYEDMIKTYNKKVNEYNDKVARYNYLLKL